MHGIELAVAPFQAAGQRFITVGVAPDAVAENTRGNTAHFDQTIGLGQRAGLVETTGPAGNPHSLITDTLEVGADLHRGDHLAEIVGQGLEPDQNGHTGFIDRFFQIINFCVVRDNPLAGLEAAGRETFAGRSEQALGERGHHQHGVAQRAERIVKITQRMLGCGKFHDRAP